MKKLFLLGFAFCITPAFAADFTPDTSDCVQVIQHAVSPKGICETFATPCEVPAGWKTISSCALVKPKERNSSFSDVDNRRRLLRTSRIRDIAIQQRNAKPLLRRTSGQPRIGRASYTKRRGSDNLRLNTSGATSFLNNRRSTVTQFNNEEAYARFQELNSETMPGRKTEGEFTDLQKYQQAIIDRGGQRRPGWITATQMKRTGYLDMTSYFSQRAMKNDPGTERHWRELHPDKRKKHERREPSNRRGWKGDRLEGDLRGILRD